MGNRNAFSPKRVNSDFTVTPSVKSVTRGAYADAKQYGDTRNWHGSLPTGLVTKDVSLVQGKAVKSFVTMVKQAIAASLSHSSRETTRSCW